MLTLKKPLEVIAMEIKRIVDGFWGIQALLDDLKNDIEEVLDNGETAVVTINIGREKT